ncbi:MAG: hypothetical protein AAGJ18_02105, partial [Bacteroidota bacterium]
THPHPVDTHQLTIVCEHVCSAYLLVNSTTLLFYKPKNKPLVDAIITDYQQLIDYYFLYFK